MTMANEYPKARDLGAANTGPYASGSGSGAGKASDAPNVGAVVNFLILENSSGANAPIGTAVKLALGGAALAFTTSTTLSDERVCGITLEAIGNGKRGRVALGGRVRQARVASGSTRGQWLRQSATAGVLTGVDSPTTGTFAIQVGDRNATSGLAEVVILHQHSRVSDYLGDGSDGDVTISADTSLTRDMYYNSLTVDSGKTLTTAGYRVFVRGTLTVNGTMGRPGNAGSGASGGGGGGAQNLLQGKGGGAGDSTGAGGTAGGAATNGAGGAGGAGGAAGTLNGAGGAVTAISETVGGARVLKQILNTLTLRDLSATQIAPGAGGGGGGQGSAGDGLGAGGGGGGGGGGVMIAAASILGSGSITANGGGGANGVAGGGGGGGGGGGVIMLVTGTTPTITPTVTGGAPGAGNAGGANGSAGADGTALVIIL